MAKPRMDLSAFVGKLLEEQDGDVLREGIRVLSQALMESEVAGLIGADRHERTPERTGHRNGYRMRTWDTRVGTIELAIPKVRPGTYFPSLLQPRRRAEHALLAVVQEAYVHGVSTRKVDELMKALGLDGVSKSEVSRICAELDPLVDAFRTRALTTDYPYIWVDATYHKVRVNGRVTSQATVVAVGGTSEGERQVLGIDVGPSEDRAFWTAFLRSLVKRGLRGVRLVVSDAHEGLKQAIATVLTGTAWQRCRVHFMRNLLATVTQTAREAVAAVVRTIFAQPDHATALAQLRKVAEALRPRFPRTATLLEDAAEDILAYRHLPIEHQRQLHSTNPLERLNKEIKRRSNVVGIFPNAAAVIRLVGAILIEQDDEWAVAERRYFSAESMKLPTTPLLSTTTQEILAAIGYRILHMAAHGIVSTKVPARSALVLRPSGVEDGLLQAREILDLRLNATLVTLSACDTSTGADQGQDGVASLVRPFVAAGARAVVANLWAADDTFSAALMREFYRELAAGVDIGESLRRAKLRMIESFGPEALPKLWSGVLAYGDASAVVASNGAATHGGNK